MAFDYSARDQNAQLAFYVLLWKRNGIALEAFDDYWRDVHGPVCARLPGQYQYWQFHGIAELTSRSAGDRQNWLDASKILMDDEHNLFRKAIGYISVPGSCPPR